MVRRVAIVRAWLGAGFAIGLTACGSSPTEPTPVPPQPASLTITCPAGASGVSHLGQPATVTWSAPTTTGGTAPVTTTCTPASGSSFQPGTASVTCRAADAGAQSVSCGFTVTVTRAPQLSITRFMAFGDSITEGKSQDPPVFLSDFVAEPYPMKLNSLLTSRFADQTITVFNRGWSGEMIATGLLRLPGAMAETNPEAVLLLHGANDLLGNPSSATTQYIAARLREMVRVVQSRSIVKTAVMLATFPPQREGTYPYDRGAGRAFVPELNQRIADVARSENAILVDLYAGFPIDTSKLISVDGLHPTPDGYALMAQIFNQAVIANFEVKPAGSPFTIR